MAGQMGDVLVLYPGNPADCATPPDVGIKPFSTFLGARTTKLRVRIAPCMGGSPPKVKCVLTPGRSQDFNGWTHDLDLDLPDSTGIHPLSLSCSVGGQTLGTFKAALYLTLKEARPIPRNPPPEWYELVTTWATGFKARDQEARVLRTILGRLYNHGQQRWRYGFCKQQGKHCAFGKTKIDLPAPPDDLLCGDGFCRCRWNQILPNGKPAGCNVSTCFGFSEAFEFLSALMGIGGLREHVETGTPSGTPPPGKGFVLYRWARPIDPALHGFVHCGDRDQLCFFFFLNHDLRERDLAYYDITFGRIYSDLGELVAQNVKSRSSFNYQFESGAACFRQDGYGEWFYYELAEKMSACTPVGGGRLRKPEGFEMPDPSIGIPPPPALFVPGSVQAAWRDNEIEVAATAEVKAAGSYSVDVRLARNGETVTYGNTIVHLDQGRGEPVRFRFPVEEELQETAGYALTAVLYALEPLRHLDDAEVEVDGAAGISERR